jgi:hypothetical protein
MLSPPGEAQEAAALLDRHPGQRLEWARRRLGTSALAPYTVSPPLFPDAARVVYNAVGGVDVTTLDPTMRAEVLENLQTADDVAVRDAATCTQLQAAGIPARLMPDPAVMVAELFGTTIRQRFTQGEVARTLQGFPQGYITVQYSADFGDDRTLAEIATQLDQLAAETGYAIVFFRAGAAPWHDDVACYRRTVTRMQAAVALFLSLDLWDICALIAGSQAFCGSSLHGGIVATAFALPRVNFRHPLQEGRPTKQDAYAGTWEGAALPTVVSVAGIADATQEALASHPSEREHIARELVVQYRRGFEPIRTALA